MILDSITICNFRQFYGEYTINFSQDKSKNITVLYGANGAGKTTLLNALTWAFFREFTPAFENNSQLLNERAFYLAQPGTKVKAWIKVKFSHDDKFFEVTRTREVIKKDSSYEAGRDIIEPGMLELIFIDENGKTQRPNNPEDRINLILPKRLYQFFFFDGERIEAFTKDDAFDEIEGAIKSVLGLEIIERGIAHLENHAQKILKREWADLSSGDSTELLAAIEKLEQENQRKKKRKKEAANELSALRVQLQKVEEKLRKLSESKALQQERDDCKRERKEKTAQIAKIKDVISSDISMNGFSVFLSDLLSNCSDILEEKRKIGELPIGIKKQFIEDLLENQKTCICGTPLEKGSGEYNSVLEWKRKAGLADVDEAVTTTKSEITSILDLKSMLLERIASSNAEIQSHHQRIEEITERLSEISTLLTDKQTENISALEEARKNLDVKKEDLNREIGGITKIIDLNNSQLEQYNKKVKELDAQSVEAQTAKRRLIACEDAISVVNRLFENQKREVREQLEKRVQGFFSEVSFKPYNPEITEDYHLVLKKEVGGKPQLVSKGTAENQILSLSFISSVVSYSRDKYEDYKKNIQDTTDLMFQGGIYPLAMDSPFGSLDVNYQKAIAESIPELAPQIVLMVSKSQGQSHVEQILRNKVGRVAVFVYSTPKENQPEEQINIDGKSYPYIEKSIDQFEGAQVLEVY